MGKNNSGGYAAALGSRCQDFSGLVTTGQSENEVLSVRSELSALGGQMDVHQRHTRWICAFARVPMHRFTGGGEREAHFLWENPIFRTPPQKVAQCVELGWTIPPAPQAIHLHSTQNACGGHMLKTLPYPYPCPPPAPRLPSEVQSAFWWRPANM